MRFPFILVVFSLFTLLILPSVAVSSTESSFPQTTRASKLSSGAKNYENSPFERLLREVKQFTLSNGLKVVFYRRPRSAVFSGQLWVKVGGVDEVPGVTGISHLLEHMAFKGTDKIGTKDIVRERELLQELDTLVIQEKPDKLRLKNVYEELESIWLDNEFSRIYHKRGAVGLNAGTSKDYTVYLVSLPNVAFEFWCWVESERILNPVFRQFYKEREVVLEERRLRTDDNPHGLMYEALLSTAFWTHPNRLPVIGWPSDVRNITTDDIKRLHQTYYRPDNMVLGLVGDLEIAKVKPLLEKYFARIPVVSTPIPKVRTIEEPQRGEREAVVEYDAEPSLVIAFHKPAFPNPDDGYFAVMHSLLSDGRSSLLYRELVEEKKLAVSVSTSEAPGERYPSVFYVQATPRNGVSNLKLRDAIQDILDRLKSSLFPKRLLEAAKRRVMIGILSGLTSNYGLNRFLAKSELLWGDWKNSLKLYNDIVATTPEDIQRLAKTYFNKQNRTYVHLEPLSMKVSLKEGKGKISKGRMKK